MRKLLAVALGAMLSVSALLLSACKGGDKDYPMEEGATEIVFYAYNFEEWSNNWIYEKVLEFNSIMDDGIQIHMIPYEDADYVTMIKSAREGNRAPDINMVSYGNLYEDVKKGYNADIGALMGEEAIADLTDYAKEMVVYKNAEGKDTYYAYPQLVEPSSLLFYNKDMLKNAGVTKDPATWSFSDLLDACAKIKPALKRSQFTIGLPTGFPLAWSTIGLQRNCAGYEVLTDDWSDTNIVADIATSSEEYQSENGYANLMRLYWNLYAGGYVPLGNVSPKGYNDIIEALCGEKLAMTYAGSWSIAEIMNTYPSMAERIGVCPIPTVDGTKDGVTATNGGWTYAISSTSSPDKQQKAATFLKWLLCDDTQRTASYFEAAYYSKYPVNKSVQEYIDSHPISIDQSWMDAVSDVANRAIPEPIYPFDVSLKVSAMFEWIAINADGSMTSKQVDNAFKQQLTTCITEIRSIIQANGIAGKNPRA